MIEVKYILINKNAKPFSYTRPRDACMDVYSCEKLVIPAGEVGMISTGVCIELPRGYEGIIRGRSGLAKLGLQVHFGTIDEEYRGEIKVLMYNSTPLDYQIGLHSRIAQFTMKRVHPMRMKEVVKLTETFRGEQGFGSSGV